MKTSKVGLLATLALCSIIACSGEADDSGINDGSGSSFALPDSIALSVHPYDSIESALADEQNIDWRKDTERANAITIAYAARELQEHLGLVGIDVHFVLGEIPPRASIFLGIVGDGGLPNLPDYVVDDLGLVGDQGYVVYPNDSTVNILANNRVGVLYGVYGLLAELGFVWDDPRSTYLPEVSTGVIQWPYQIEFPRTQKRGYWIYGDQIVDSDFAVWMARNRLNLGAQFEPAIKGKVGMLQWSGGHELLQQEFSQPGLFETNPHWFAEVNGVRRPVAASGTYFNPAFGNEEAANFFAERMIARLQSGDLTETDILNIWPADTRGNRFDQSTLAISTGNETDNLLYFNAVIAQRLREAFASGELDRRVTVAGISYYLTWEPPTNDTIVESLSDEDYIHIFYFNERSWDGVFNSSIERRDIHRQLVENLESWRQREDLQYGVIEYFNYSVYAGVALSDYLHFGGNSAQMAPWSGAMYGYMHPLNPNPGPRRLSNLLMAKLLWTDEAEAESTAESIVEEYFQRRFGEHAEDWSEVNSLMARSIDNSREMFGPYSFSWVLLQNQIWSGPAYPDADTARMITQYRVGGAQLIPELPFGYSTLVRSEEFRGLDSSILLQVEAAQLWTQILELDLPANTRSAMLEDVAWFEATASRYRLMAAASDYTIAVQMNQDVTDAQQRIRTEVDFLRASTVTDATISPLDQRGFLAMFESLADLD